MAPADPLKTVKLQIRMTPMEREYLDALASRQQMTASEYIRWSIRKAAEKVKL